MAPPVTADPMLAVTTPYPGCMTPPVSVNHGLWYRDCRCEAQLVGTQTYIHSQDMQRYAAVQMHEMQSYACSMTPKAADWPVLTRRKLAFHPQHTTHSTLLKTSTHAVSKVPPNSGHRPSGGSRGQHAAWGKRQSRSAPAHLAQLSTLAGEMTCSAPPLPKRAIRGPKEGIEARVHTLEADWA